MGRIIAPVVINNTIKPEYRITCDALVDTGASYMVLPSAWKNKLGDIETVEQIEVEMANQTALSGEICGPVKIQIEGFRPIYTEVLFIDMKPENGIYDLVDKVPEKQISIQYITNQNTSYTIYGIACCKKSS